MNQAVLITKHDKAKCIANALAPLGFDVVESNAFDTDSLGTFAGDIERTLSPKEAALKKAKMACELLGAEFGLGSEGSFGNGPYPGIVNWNDEILCFYERATGQAIYATASGPFAISSIQVDSETCRDTLLKKLNHFQSQRWLLKFDEQVLKGLSSETLIETLADKQLTKALIEPDLRAMHCPLRQQMISKAADDLANRLSAICPKCNAKNFVVKEAIKGLPCEQCGLATQQIKQHKYHCECCDHTELKNTEQTAADPYYCQLCNP